MSILAYHMVDKRFDWGITRVTPGQFNRQIKFALKKGYLFLTVGEYAKSFKSKKVAITFDDAYESVHKYALPILQKYNIPATVFVNPAYVGQQNTWDVNIGWLKFKHMNWKQIIELDKVGWEIGSHGLSHRDLTRLDKSTLKKELALSKRLLERRLIKQVSSVSYPFGNTNQHVCKISRDIGYTHGYVMSRGLCGDSEAMSFTRTGIYLLDSSGSFDHKISEKGSWFYKTIQSTLDFCSDGTVVVKEGLWLRNKNKS